MSLASEASQARETLSGVAGVECTTSTTYVYHTEPNASSKSRRSHPIQINFHHYLPFSATLIRMAARLILHLWKALLLLRSCILYILFAIVTAFTFY